MMKVLIPLNWFQSYLHFSLDILTRHWVESGEILSQQPGPWDRPMLAYGPGDRNMHLSYFRPMLCFMGGLL